jgi:hypothetical protein
LFRSVHHQFLAACETSKNEVGAQTVFVATKRVDCIIWWFCFVLRRQVSARRMPSVFATCQNGFEWFQRHALSGIHPNPSIAKLRRVCAHE